MSISYKKIVSMIDEVVQTDSRFDSLDKDALKKLCMEIYALESTIDGTNRSTSELRSSIKGKVALKFDDILKVN